MELTRHKRADPFFPILCVGLIVTAYGLRLWLLPIRRFDQDEFEHLHAAWLFAQGYLPYRDFFEHHTPGLYFLLRPLFERFDPAAGITQALATMVAGRRLMWLLTGVILLLTFQLGRSWRSWRTGLLGTVFLGSVITFLQKTLEIRPDVPALVCWMGCLAALLGGMRRDAAGGRGRGWWAGSGILLGLALMMTQKVLFALPGFTLALTWFLLDHRSRGSFRTRAGNIVCLWAGCALPVALTLGYFACRHGLPEFIEFNLLLNLRWKSHSPPTSCIRTLLVPNPAISLLGVLGLGRALWRMFTRAGFQRSDFVPALNTLGLIIGLYIIPVPQRQYLLLFLPLLALHAADAVIGFVALMMALRDRGVFERYFAWMLGGAGILVFVTGLTAGRALGRPGDALHVYARVSLALCALFLTWVPARGRRPDFALAVVVALLCLEPLPQMRSLSHNRNDRQLAALQYVLENTTRDDAVMDGWQGVGVFRPHAYFYWMLHEEIRALLTPQQVRQLLEDLRCDRIAPVLMNLDADLWRLSPEITAFLEEAYAPVGTGSIRRRKEELPAPMSEPGSRPRWSEAPVAP